MATKFKIDDSQMANSIVVLTLLSRSRGKQMEASCPTGLALVLIGTICKARGIIDRTHTCKNVFH